MYCNFSLADQKFIDMFSSDIAPTIKNNIYYMYMQCGKKKTNKLSMDQYFSSKHIKYKFVYTYCPKCKMSGFLLSPYSKSYIEGLKYCGSCGESNISYRYQIGYRKTENLLNVSKLLFKMGKETACCDLNQQLMVLLNSIMEAYLRDFYAGLLNAKFVNAGDSLFEKFTKECKNDFQSPSKANDRLRKELKINFKDIIGERKFKSLTELSAYRNVIAHNSGICDQQFINLGIGNYNLHDNINLSINDVRGFMTDINDSVHLLDIIYQDIIKQQIIYNLQLKVLTKAPDAFTILVPPRLKIINDLYPCY